ncbi:MAG: efflux RND transporter permease subunit [Mucinivorans sp.]
MLNKIIQFSLANRLAVLIAAALLLLGGAYTASNMEVDILPDLNAPTVVIMTEAKGLAPTEVERIVTFPVETAVNGAVDVRRVRSSSTSGFSVVWVEFDWGTDIYRARQIVSEKLATIEGTLPESVGRPTLGPQGSILGELMIIGLSSDSLPLTELRETADWTIRPRLIALGGVASVSVIGGEVKEYQIMMDPAAMRHHGVTLDEILAASQTMNENSSGGVVEEYGNEYIIRGMAASTDPDVIGSAVVKTVGDQPILLNQVARVAIGAKTPRLGTASERGKAGVLITVSKQTGANTIQLTKEIDRTLLDLQKTLPKGVHLSTDIFRQSRFIETSINNISRALIEGGIFVVLILFLFLMNVRTTLISLVTIPLSLLVSILALKVMGLTINTMSLGGMAIAIGSLVDDAIVDVDNVLKRLTANYKLPKDKRQNTIRVVFEASREVRMPILNSTIIIVASFVPLFFLSGIEGRMLVPLGVAFIVALFASTIVALTLTPVLCSYLLGGDKMLSRSIDREPFVARILKKWYRRALDWALLNKKIVLSATGLALLAAVAMFFTLGSNFLPPFNEGSFTINVSTMPGISLAESDKIGRTAEEILLSIPEIQTVARKTGRAELDEHALGVNTSEIEAPFVLTGRTKEELSTQIREKMKVIAGANIEIGQPISHRIDAMLSGTKANVAIKIFGENLTTLHSTGVAIGHAIEKIEGVASATVEQQVERPELTITPRAELMAKYGVTMPQFGRMVDVMLSGKVVSMVMQGNKRFDVTLKADPATRASIDQIREMMIDTPRGVVSLGEIATVSSAMGPNSVSRENGSRKIVVSVGIQDRDLASVVKDIQHAVDKSVTLPEGYHVEYGGQFESQQSASRTLTIASIFAILVIFMLLYGEFKNTKETLVILLNLPLAIIGGIFTIYFTDGVLSIPSIIGFISLFGITVRNGMLLISRYNDLRATGNHSVLEIVRLGSIDRLNPILMTALTSALALLPLALGGATSGSEIQSPMAVVILGGLLSSTLLNAFVIPIMYTLIDKKR